MPKSVGQRVLERAAEKLGEPQLANRLGISKTVLRMLLSGIQPVPDSIMLQAVDVVMDELPDFVAPADVRPQDDEHG